MTDLQNNQNIFEVFNNVRNLLSEIFRSINDAIVGTVKACNQYLGQLEQAFRPIARVIKEALEKAPEATSRILIFLGQHGWFVSMDMPASTPFVITEKLLNGESEVVDNWMCDYYEETWEELKQDIDRMCPSRSSLLDCAFAAHQREEYALSIPVFLAQVDGICKELIGYELFRKDRKGKPRTSEFVDQFTADSLMAALLEPFRTPLPITASEKERKDIQVSFNRHQILHGEVVDYGTRVNSCKAISLLAYICSALSLAIKDDLQKDNVYRDRE